MNQPLDLVPEPPVLPEPVGIVEKHTGALKDMSIIRWYGEQPAEGTKLYAAPERTTEAMTTPQPPEVVSKQAPETAEREAFEKWATHSGITRLHKLGMWNAWSARAALATPQQAPEPDGFANHCFRDTPEWDAIYDEGYEDGMANAKSGQWERPSEAMADTVRLDWLDRDDIMLDPQDDGTFRIVVSTGAAYGGASIREAIDAARALVSTPAPETKPE